MQAAPRQLRALLFDSAIEDNIGYVLALTMLLGYGAKGEARLTSLSVSRNNLRTAAFCDLMARFFGTSLSIGMAEAGAPETSVTPMLSAVLDRKTAEGKPLYPRNISRLNETADPVALIRNALSAQPDQNSTVILSGPSVNLLGLLALPEGKDIVKKKVRTLVVAAQSNAKLLAEWPSPVVVAGEDLGQALKFPAESIDRDFAWATNHPLIDAYRAANAMPYDAPSSAMAAVLYAAHPDDGYFKVSQQQLLADPDQKDRIVQAYRQAVSAKPPEPRRGGRGA
jgi:purine nucleosidase